MHINLLAIASIAVGALADEANLCRVTSNYGCQLYGYNCNDIIGTKNVPTFSPTALFGAVCPGTKSDDKTICCTTSRLNGGYCPNADELQKYGFELSGFGGNQNYQLREGPAVVKCNQNGGPHYCMKSVRLQGGNKCLDCCQY